jgi:hypothetical protein
MTFGIGSIGCKKDAAGLLNASLAPKLNEGLKRIVRYTRSSSTGDITGDGFLTIYRKDGEEYSASFEETLVPYGWEIYLKVPI